MAMTQVFTSEWTKIRSVSSTSWTLALAASVTIALGAVISIFAERGFDDMSRQDQLTFDPTQISFAGTSLGQLAMIVFGVLVVANEYTTGMIRTSLAAVPRRSAFLFGKIAVASGLAFAVSLVTSFLAFFVGQAMLGDHSAALGDSGVLRAVFGSALYMTLIAVFSMGVAVMLRSATLSLGVLMPFFFLISNILGSISATEKFGRWLPDQAGMRIMQVVAPADDSTPYGPWGGLLVMALWVLASVAGGWLMLRRRDA
ncbi:MULTISPECIES: ABC transporter permease [Streptomyces]|uniref:ABC transporter n=1 Tax=Streptomyces albus (strain ATCC 21838 / DSM 41398 / FERM P-419 / JCM 4703 / NBRC 107858) TaxID=1081613 RepID=A0A0B5EMK6_STRA4|nr:ABC transporter permease [Streptomyces sp. SCSIO ZS0520]AJE83718.1 ABC transporter [Streptomyces albus]AOU78024.1 ABC transporter [Streptomyces albus]AYN33779.1 ABC transporter permease [Streptomyces albus]